jgi:hypothetical protein
MDTLSYHTRPHVPDKRTYSQSPTIPDLLLLLLLLLLIIIISFLGFTAQLRPWPPPQNPIEFLGGFSTIFFFTGWGC